MFTYNFRIYRGTTVNERFVWSENGVPVNLTGWQAKMQLKNTVLDATYTLSTDTGELALGTAGEIDLVLDDTVTINMLPGSYAWDLLLRNPQGDILAPILAGTITVLQGVTQW